MSGKIAVTSDFEPAAIRLGVVRGISYGLFGEPGEFVPQARALGAGLIRAYLYWGQVEPKPGSYNWTAGIMSQRKFSDRYIAETRALLTTVPEPH